MLGRRWVWDTWGTLTGYPTSHYTIKALNRTEVYFSDLVRWLCSATLRRMQDPSFISSLPSLRCCPHPDGSRWTITTPTSHTAERRKVEVKDMPFPLRTKPRGFKYYFCLHPPGSAIFMLGCHMPGLASGILLLCERREECLSGVRSNLCLGCKHEQFLVLS